MKFSLALIAVAVAEKAVDANYKDGACMRGAAYKNDNRIKYQRAAAASGVLAQSYHYGSVSDGAWYGSAHRGKCVGNSYFCGGAKAWAMWSGYGTMAAQWLVFDFAKDETIDEVMIDHWGAQSSWLHAPKEVDVQVGPSMNGPWHVCQRFNTKTSCMPTYYPVNPCTGRYARLFMYSKHRNDSPYLVVDEVVFYGKPPPTPYPTPFPTPFPTPAPTTESKHTSVANWWGSFDRYGWSNCNTKDGKYKYIDGLWRNHRGCERLYCIEQASCSVHLTEASFHSQKCYNANWWGSFDRKGWSTCNNGYFLSGLMRNHCDKLYCLEEAKCCKSQQNADTYKSCYNANWWGSFDNKGWSRCNDGHHIAGLYRNGCNELYCIEMAKCCKPSDATSYPTGFPTTFPTGFPTGFPTTFPTTFPTGFPTGFPTSFPTSTPTSAPTASCPVTCALIANKGMRVKRWPLGDKRRHNSFTIKVTHDVLRVNSGITYIQHRCYRDGSQCLCECLDHEPNFQAGMLHGKAHRKNSKKYMPNQGISGVADYNPNPTVKHNLKAFWTDKTAVKDPYTCDFEKNFISGQRYSQISLTDYCRNGVCNANPKYGGANSKDKAIAYCKKTCHERKGCTGFFFQTHGNGHEICGFYTGKVNKDASQWHGHKNGAICFK